VRIYEAPGTDAGISWNWSAYPLPAGSSAAAVAFEQSGAEVIVATVADPMVGADGGASVAPGYCILR
jgi:hypothetical protein